MAITVYPQPGFTYPDADAVTITAAGATVDESEYIQDAIDAGFLMTWDPLLVNMPDDRTTVVVPVAPFETIGAGVSVWPQEGREYPDAAGDPITSIGAMVDESEYIMAAIDAGYLLTWDPLSVYQPDDRTDAGGGASAPLAATYVTLTNDGTLTNERALAVTAPVVLTDGGAGGAVTLSAPTAVVGPVSANDERLARFDGATGKLIQSSPVTLDDTGNLTGVVAIAASHIDLTGSITLTTPGATVDGVDLTAQALVIADKVTGPVLAADESLVRFDGLTGKLVQGSVVSITDAGNISGVGDITLSGTVDGVDVSALSTTVTALGVPSYVTLAASGALANERVLTAGAGVAFTDGGAGGALTVRQTYPAVTQAVTAYTLTPADAFTHINLFNAAPIELTIPEQALATFVDGTEIHLAQTNQGTVSITLGTGVSLLAAGQFFTGPLSGVVSLPGRYSACRLLRTASNQWMLGWGLPKYVVTLAATSLTLTNQHAGNTVATTSASATTITLPSSTVPVAVGTIIGIHQTGAGQVTVAAGAGVTLNVPSGFTAKTRNQYSEVTVTQIATNVWDITGSLEDSTSYLTLSATSAYPNERVLTAGTNITLDSTVPGVLTVNGASTGAPTTAQYLTLASDGTLTNERVLTAGAGMAFTDGGAGGALTVSNLRGRNAVAAPYTFVLADAGKVVSNGTVDGTLTIPTNASVAFPDGTVLYVNHNTSGILTIDGSLVTLRGKSEGSIYIRQGCFAILSKVTGNIWDLYGETTETQSFRTESNASYTLALGDVGRVLRSSVGTAITVPDNTTVAIPVGTEVYLEQTGATQVTVVAGGGVTLNTPSGFTAATRNQWSIIRLHKIATNAWDLSGELQDNTPYLTLGATAAYPNERVLTAGGGISLDSTVAGVLTISSTAGVAGTQAVVARASGGQAISALTNTTIAFAVEDSDVSGNFASNTYTVPITGLYQVNINVAVPSAAGAGVIYFALAGAPVTGVGFAQAFGGFEQSQYSQVRPLTAGQLVTAMVQTTNATTITTAQIDIHRVA